MLGVVRTEDVVKSTCDKNGTLTHMPIGTGNGTATSQDSRQFLRWLTRVAI